MAGAHGCSYCGVSFEGAPPPPPNPHADPEIVRLIRSNNKIEAIKRYREMTGLGLKESKDGVEEIEARLRR
jgi:large subunit ribosomal protein L7/L12